MWRHVRLWLLRVMGSSCCSVSQTNTSLSPHLVKYSTWRNSTPTMCLTPKPKLPTLKGLIKSLNSVIYSESLHQQKSTLTNCIQILTPYKSMTMTTHAKVLYSSNFLTMTTHTKIWLLQQNFWLWQPNLWRWLWLSAVSGLYDLQSQTRARGRYRL